jgi:lipopolysaccharide export system permease protein
MLLMDRYLLRQFAQVFLICFCSLVGLFIVIDAFGNLEEFLSHAEQAGGLAWVLAEYYGYRLLSFFELTSSVLALIAAMFTLTWIQRHNELTAIQAAGIPRWRVVKPVVAAAAVIAMVAMVNREVVVPSVRDKFSRNAQDLSGDSGKALPPRYDHRTDVLIRGKQTFAATQQIDEPNFLLPATLDHYGKQLQAAAAFYLPAEGQRPAGYLLRGMVAPKDLAQLPSLELDGRPIIITPRDAAWLASDECFVASDVTFEHLTGASVFRDFASTWELIRALRNPSLDFGADVPVAIHSRLVKPLLDMTLLLLGLPLVLSRENRNMFLAIGLCLVVVVAFWLVVLGFQYLGRSYLVSPALAAWGPLMVFVPLAVALSDPLRQ